MFEYLKKAVNEQMEAERKENQHFIAAGFKDQWSKEYQNESDEGIKEYLTETRWKQYQDGTITRQQAVNFAIARAEKQHKKAIEKKNGLLDQYASAPDVISVDIFVEWKRNRTWGYNPTATVTVNTSAGTYTATGSASGCGYDKRTAAVGNALNEIDAIKKMLCTCKENAIKAGKKSNNPLELNSNSNASYISYGAGYGVIPYFEGGVGMSSFENVFNACGFVLDHCHETDSTDYYYFTKKGA